MSQPNCLQCRHCSLLPQTDFTMKSAIIWCAAINDNRVINLEGCPSGELTRQYPMGPAWSPVADGFLSTHYETAPMPVLELRLRRERKSIYQRAHRLGFRDERKRHVLRGKGPNAVGDRITWTAEQDAFLTKIYGGPRWPPGGHTSTSDRRKPRIIARINQLGPSHSWRAIMERARKTTPAGRKRADDRRKKHTIYQREARRGKKLNG